jgi:hypothetical protein
MDLWLDELIVKLIVKSIYLKMGRFDRSMGGSVTIFFDVVQGSPDRRRLDGWMDGWMDYWVVEGVDFYVWTWFREWVNS